MYDDLTTIFVPEKGKLFQRHTKQEQWGGKTGMANGEGHKRGVSLGH